MGSVETQPGGEWTDRAIAALFGHAEQFLRAGGKLSWAEWCSMDATTKAAFSRAGDMLDTERAIACGLATQGIDAQADLVAEFDGGEMKRRIVLERMAARIDVQLRAAAEAHAAGKVKA